MIRPVHSEKIVLVGSYPPRRCGIATFSADVVRSIEGQYADAECLVVPVTDVPEGYAYPAEARFEIREQDPASYREAAKFINGSGAKVVSLQHEFGIYGGPAGSHILTLLRALRVPVVSHLHTIQDQPAPAFRRVLEEIVRLSARTVVMSQRGRELIETVYGAAPDRIDVIPHGIPDMPFVDPHFYKEPLGLAGRRVILTSGLLSPNKGIEYMIEALPQIVRKFPAAIYIVLGATHPVQRRLEGEAYRLMLERLVDRLGLTRHVLFCNRFVSDDELKKFLGAADVYVTPYLDPTQITSGGLSYAFGCGRAVVSTPYWHAGELLADGRGVLVPFRDSAALAREINALLDDDVRRREICHHAYRLGREMIWRNVARRFMTSYAEARHRSLARPARRSQKAQRLPPADPSCWLEPETDGNRTVA
ncbi:MAG TPA: glycosyltransferase family 4 protein [Opitutaceae bacterium]|nr:glycosyltransferase family 4 protein [Opitutaceae bacterium]